MHHTCDIFATFKESCMLSFRFLRNYLDFPTPGQHPAHQVGRSASPRHCQGHWSNAFENYIRGRCCKSSHHVSMKPVLLMQPSAPCHHSVWLPLLIDRLEGVKGPDRDDVWRRAHLPSNSEEFREKLLCKEVHGEVWFEFICLDSL